MSGGKLLLADSVFEDCGCRNSLVLVLDFKEERDTLDVVLSDSLMLRAAHSHWYRHTSCCRGVSPEQWSQYFFMCFSPTSKHTWQHLFHNKHKFTQEPFTSLRKRQRCWGDALQGCDWPTVTGSGFRLLGVDREEDSSLVMFLTPLADFLALNDQTSLVQRIFSRVSSRRVFTDSDADGKLTEDHLTVASVFNLFSWVCKWVSLMKSKLDVVPVDAAGFRFPAARN